MFNLFGQNKVIIYLKRNSLELIKDGHDTPSSHLDFPPNIAKWEEIIDRAKFENLLSSFLLKEISKREKIIILLSDEVVFQKTFPKDQIITDGDFQKFVAAIPFDPLNLSAKQVKTQNELYFTGTNKTLYEIVVSLLAQHKIKVQAVVPAIIFGINDPLISNNLSNITSNSKLLKAANFLEKVKAPENLPAKSKIENIRNKNVTQAILAVFAILLFSTAAALLYTRYFKPVNKTPTNYLKSTEIPSVTLQSTPEASPKDSTQEATLSPQLDNLKN